ncbi:helix-turn-helix domain-containing protein [Paracoccus laeviglucosivorans]|uniref:helix-turn-helix domain-containing protein n=1 Tax=Paracoccus laeviglucosivorans TaxID=1197861 RepID=UPI0011590935|nr:helix-turn-helix transcriptional regulator [Paracoccus laeviglucosivorans]
MTGIFLTFISSSMVTLETHLRQSGEKQADFAVRVNVRQGTVSKLCRGQMIPSMMLAQRIERATGGKVPVAIWVSGETVDQAAISPPPPNLEHPHENAPTST